MSAYSLADYVNAMQAGSSHWNNFPGNPGATVDIRALLAQGLQLPHDFVGYQFPTRVIFDGLRFPDGFSFADADFKGGASFDNAHFLGKAKFNGLKVRGPVTFRNTRFRGEVDFQRVESHSQGSLIFRFARFYSDANFAHLIAHGDAFEIVRCVSKGLVQFRNSTVSPTADFTRSMFSSVTFGKTVFRRGARFTRCRFLLNADFLDTEFKEVCHFRFSVFEREANFSATSVNEHQIESAQFSNARFLGPCLFRRRQFVGPMFFRYVQFKEAPQFYGAGMSSENDFEHSTYGNITRANASESERAYRTLKAKMSEQQHHRAEALFFAKEMEAKKYSDGSPVAKVFYFTYGVLSSFGQSVMRPLLGFLVVLVVFGTIYAMASERAAIKTCNAGCKLQFDGGRAADLVRMSFFQSIPFLDTAKANVEASSKRLFGQRRPPRYVLVAQAFEALLAGLFLFLIGLALRNLFRLR